jgi:hypothetical protein
MWLEIIIQLAMLGCLAVLVWYAGEALPVFNRIDRSFDKLRTFLDAQDVNKRADGIEDRAEMGPLWGMGKQWLPATYSRLGKLLASADGVKALMEELASQRRTFATPPPPSMTAPPPADEAAAPVAATAIASDAVLSPELVEVARQMDAASSDGNRVSDYDGETQIHKSAALRALLSPDAPASMPDTTPKPGANPASRERVSPTAEIEARSRTSAYHQPYSLPAPSGAPSEPAQIAAGIGPRPPSSRDPAEGSTRPPHAPPVKLSARGAISQVSRKQTLVGGTQAVEMQRATADSPLPDDDPDKRLSWAALKQQGMIGASVTHPVSKPRFPGTMASMQAVTPPGTAPPSSSRRAAAPVEVKEKCRSCDGGFIHVGTGGIGTCKVCSGSGLVEAAARA